MLIGAVNAFNKKTNNVVNTQTGEYGEVPTVQRAYKASGIPTVVVGDHNYGEGSSREHAAMEPRHLGVRVVLVRSFARIHETNLKKQGVLPLTFANSADYDSVQEGDTVDLTGIAEIAPGSSITARFNHEDGTSSEIIMNHSLNKEQIDWFKAGSALNFLRG